MFTEEEIVEIGRLIVAAINPEKIILFGSYAKGVATIRSDLDLMVVLQSNAPLGYRKEALMPILNRYVIKIDIHVYTPAEVEILQSEPYSFVKAVMETGRVCFERS